MSRKKKCSAKKSKNAFPVKFSLFRREVKIKVTVFNRARLFNALARENIHIKSVISITSNQFIIIIYQKDYAKTFAICNRLCYNCIVVGYIGLFCWLKSKLNRVALIVGTLTVAVLFFVANFFLLDVKITGTETIAKTEFLSYLKNKGIKSGLPLTAIDRDYVKMVVNSFDGVAECSVKVVGHTLYVHVAERDKTVPKPLTAQNLCSRFDATVTRIVCESGTTKVNIGQRVKSGEMLIEGKLYDQNGQELMDVTASGKVYGKVTKKRVFITSLNSYSLSRTGKSKSFTQLRLWGITLGKVQSPFINYESERTQSFLPLLPIKVERTVFYETERKEIQTTRESLVEKCTTTAQSEFICDTDENTEIKTHVRELSQTEYEITVYMTTEREIT